MMCMICSPYIPCHGSCLDMSSIIVTRMFFVTVVAITHVFILWVIMIISLTNLLMASIIGLVFMVVLVIISACVIVFAVVTVSFLGLCVVLGFLFDFNNSFVFAIF